eukprot:828034-Pelagomonas_calceolata.AAC.1
MPNPFIHPTDPDHTIHSSIHRVVNVRVTHMLYADDLTLLSNEPGALQTMLSRLNVYARKKHL